MSGYAYDLIFVIVVLEVLFAFSIGLICIVLSFNLFMALKDSSSRQLLQADPTDRSNDLLPLGDFPVIESNSSRCFITPASSGFKVVANDHPATEPLLRRDYDSYGSDEAEGHSPFFNTAASLPLFYSSASSSSENGGELSLDVAVEAAASPPKEDNNSFISVLQSFFQYVL